MHEPITIQRLEDFAVITDEYKRLIDKKKKIIAKLGLKGIDYSKEKIKSSSIPISEQERYIMSLQRVNDELKKYEDWLIPEKEIIKTQIARIKKPHYRKIIVLRYIERWKWSEIIQEFFWHEDDYEEQKFLRYKDNVMFWNRRALDELEKISSRPYIPIAKQLTFEEEN